MSLNYGDFAFSLLIIAHLAWDFRQRYFRGVLLQILGALSLSSFVNAVLGFNARPGGTLAAIVLYPVLTVGFYFWAWWIRRTGPFDDESDADGVR